MNYKKYKADVYAQLSKDVRKAYRKIEPGQWRDGKYDHILPLKNNTKEAKRQAVETYLGFKIEDMDIDNDNIHRFVHHLNSSQLLCYRTFQLLRDGKKLKDMLNNFGISIGDEAECRFEYNDDMKWEQEMEAEGTSFDFHIKDGEKELFFEIKFTEYGFGKSKDNSRHKNKITQCYRPKIKSCPLLPDDLEYKEICANYQLIRNVIRWKNDNCTIIFITDANNPQTNKEIEYFKGHVLNNPQQNVKFITWQQIKTAWPLSEMPFQFCCFQ